MLEVVELAAPVGMLRASPQGDPQQWQCPV